MGTFFSNCPAIGKRARLSFIAATLLAAGGVTQAQTTNPPYPAAAVANAARGLPMTGWPDGRFLSFSNTVFVPPIVVVSNEVIQVGDFRVTGLSQASGNRKLVAMHLGVPVGVVARLLEDSAKDPQVQNSALAQELRGATIEFHFLLAEITGTQPSPTMQQARTDALQALLLGDLSRARDFYLTLHRPLAGPTNLRIVVGP
jgi:hypothetical protein